MTLQVAVATFSAAEFARVDAAPFDLSRDARRTQNLTQAARVVIVEDEPIMRDLRNDVLREARFDVGCASNGRTALEAVAT